MHIISIVAKSMSNAFKYWMLKGKDSTSDSLGSWCLLSTIMIGIAVGFSFLLWHYPIIAFFCLPYCFLPIITVICIKHSDCTIDARLEELHELDKKYKWR